MTADPHAGVRFSSESAYDSDDDEDGAPQSIASTSTSGVILGFEDGEIAQSSKDDDEKAITVSRLGGSAVSYCVQRRKGKLRFNKFHWQYFPLAYSELPPPELSLCALCSSPMPLLVQIYAPLADEQIHPLSRPHPRNAHREEFDRCLYVFGCVKKGCVGVRCFRAAKRNDFWAEEGRTSRRREKLEQEEKERQKMQERSRNPFSAGTGPVRLPYG